MSEERPEYTLAGTSLNRGKTAMSSRLLSMQISASPLGSKIAICAPGRTTVIQVVDIETPVTGLKIKSYKLDEIYDALEIEKASLTHKNMFEDLVRRLKKNGSLAPD